MKKRIKDPIKIIFLAAIFMVATMSVCFAEEANSIEEAFKGGSLSGAIGNYFEFIDSEVDNNNSGWSTGYLTMKYETQSWNRLTFGARFFAHGELYSDHDNGTSDPFDADVETKTTLPELYLNYGFAENSGITIGRWKNVGHIDDAQSEGGYVTIKEIENLEIMVGAITRFAEIDYDDSEDFGRSNDSQALDSETTYGPGSAPMMIFLETKYSPMEMLTLNPFYMNHSDYAKVIGVDTTVKSEWEEYGVEYGALIRYYGINSEISGSDKANVFMMFPYVKKGPYSLDFKYGKNSKGNALNKPEWLVDKGILDQYTATSMAGAEMYSVKLKYTADNYWAHFGYGTANYDTSATKGEGSNEVEFQAGYDITENLDINVRYFMVTFDDIDDKDYNKVETRMEFKF